MIVSFEKKLFLFWKSKISKSLDATMASSKPNRVAIETSLGTFEVELYWNEAPKTCKNFAELSRRGYYNRTMFHRVIPDFMIQGNKWLYFDILNNILF